MNDAQFDLIRDNKFPRIDDKTAQACRAVLVGGKTSYAAEKLHQCVRGTVSRYVQRFTAELDYCEEVSHYGKS